MLAKLYVIMPQLDVLGKAPNRQQWPNPSYNDNTTRNQSNGHNDPNLQLSISTSKLNHIAKLLEATKR